MNVKPFALFRSVMRHVQKCADRRVHPPGFPQDDAVARQTAAASGSDADGKLMQPEGTHQPHGHTKKEENSPAKAESLRAHRRLPSTGLEHDVPPGKERLKTINIWH